MNSFRIILLSLLLCLTGGAARSETVKPASWELAAQIQVDSKGVFLNDLVPNLPLTTVPHVSLFPAPAYGKALVLTRSQIETAIRSALGNEAPITWAGAEKVSVARRTKMFAETELLDLLTATLQREQARDRGELELRLTRPWSDIPVPDEQLTMRVLDIPTSGISPNFIVRFELRADREVIGIWQAAVQAKLWRDVLVSRQSATRGLPASQFDFSTERRDVLVLRDPLVNVPGALELMEIGESITAGMPLTSRSFRFRPVISRGKVVDALVVDGSLQISVKVEALEDGLPGQTVRVRNLKSKREFRGKVQNEQTVIVWL
jgi:flagella basal body P-ring formation protein FlgA